MDDLELSTRILVEESIQNLLYDFIDQGISRRLVYESLQQIAQEFTPITPLTITFMAQYLIHRS